MTFTFYIWIMDNCKENEFFIMKNWNARGFVENIELVSGSYTGLAAALSTAHRQIDTAHFTVTTHCTSLLCSVVTAVSDECQFKMSLFYPDRNFYILSIFMNSSIIPTRDLMMCMTMSWRSVETSWICQDDVSDDCEVNISMSHHLHAIYSFKYLST